MAKHTLIIILAGLFVFLGYAGARFGFDTAPAWVGLGAVVSIALPSLFAFMSAAGFKRGSIILGALAGYALVFEAAGVASGVPYGTFEYVSDGLGFKLFDLVPWTVPFGWIPLLLASCWMVSRILPDIPPFEHRGFHVVCVALVLVMMDLVLDPGAVFAGYWFFRDGGTYFGVPWMNFFGWMLSGLWGSALFYGLGGMAFLRRDVAVSGLCMMAFWTGVSMAAGFVVPSIIGGGIVLGLGGLYIRSPSL